MNAKLLVDEMGDKLIGRQVWTEAIGDYCGGVATVIEIAPDPAAPEIVCRVRNSRFTSKFDPDDHEIGIYEFEKLQLL